MKRILSLVFIGLALLLVLAAGAFAEGNDTVTVYAEVTYGQTEARSMLAMINDFRTGEDAWYWNSDNDTKTVCQGLGTLAYDYELEQVAMQRAAEIALYFAHERPNGTMCFTLFPDSLLTGGENIAAGQRTAEAAYISWREDDEDYDGQGHRRNMLGADFNCIGIGHVIYNGTHYWTHTLGYKENPATSSTAAKDSDEQVRVEISSGLVSAVYCEGVEVEVFRRTDVPAASFTMTNTWPSRVRIPYSPVNEAYAPVWKAGEQETIRIDGTAIEALNAGSATITSEIFGKGLEAAVTVLPRDIANATVTLQAEGLIYTGIPQTPEATVTDGGKTLVPGVDYTIAYTGNVNASYSAAATVTGTGNYTGTARQTFTIDPAMLSVTAKDHSIIYGEAPANAGVLYAGFVNGEDERVLSGEMRYGYSYAQYEDVGEDYYITPYGLEAGNYAFIFTSGVLTVGKKEVGFAWSGLETTYNRTEQKPEAAVTGLVNNDSVTAEVAGGQTNVGSYIATVTALTGKKAGNYKLPQETTATFVILKADPDVTSPTPEAYYGQVLADVELPEGWSWKDAAKSVGNAGKRGFSAVYVPEDPDNYNQITRDVSVTVRKALPPELKEQERPKARKGLRAAGKAYALAEAPESSPEGYKKILYALGTDGRKAPTEGWSAYVPTAAAEGDYYFWYYYAGDGNHQDTEAAYVIASIHPAFGTPDFVLPEGTQKIGESAFEGTPMTVAYLPDSCGAIGAWAFRDCGGLTQIRVPGECLVGAGAFDGCKKVYIYSTAGSAAEAYCDEHDNCVFVSEE